MALGGGIGVPLNAHDQWCFPQRSKRSRGHSNRRCDALGVSLGDGEGETICSEGWTYQTGYVLKVFRRVSSKCWWFYSIFCLVQEFGVWWIIYDSDQIHHDFRTFLPSKMMIARIHRMLVKWQSVHWIAWWLSLRNLSCISKVWHESDEIQLELVMNFLSLMILIHLPANRLIVWGCYIWSNMHWFTIVWLHTSLYSWYTVRTGIDTYTNRPHRGM